MSSHRTLHRRPRRLSRRDQADAHHLRYHRHCLGRTSTRRRSDLHGRKPRPARQRGASPGSEPPEVDGSMVTPTCGTTTRPRRGRATTRCRSPLRRGTPVPCRHRATHTGSTAAATQCSAFSDGSSAFCHSDLGRRRERRSRSAVASPRLHRARSTVRERWRIAISTAEPGMQNPPRQEAVAQAHNEASERVQGLDCGSQERRSA